MQVAFAALVLSLAPQVQAFCRTTTCDPRPLNDPKGALALIESALKMNPPLEKRHQDDLRQIRNDIGGAADGGNGAPPQQ